MNLNPAYHLIEAFRAPVYAGTGIDAGALVVAATVAALTLAIGWFVFTAVADEIPTRI